jgi:hypothetical protein
MRTSHRAMLGLTAMFLLLGAGIGLTVGLWYVPSIHHGKSATCQVLACNRTVTLCDGGQSCTTLDVTYALLNGSTITNDTNHDIRSYTPNYTTVSCPAVNSTTPCYYDDRRINATLSLSSLDTSDNGAFVLILILALLALGTFVVILAISVETATHWR